MTLRFAVLIVLGLIAAAIAWRLQSRRPDPPSAPSYRAPTQLDLDDFIPNHPGGQIGHQPDSQVAAGNELAGKLDDQYLILVVFGSELCSSCAGVWDAAQRLAPSGATIKLVNVEDEPDLHKRYKIDGVPTLVIADGEGVVRSAFFGPVTDEVLAEALPG